MDELWNNKLIKEKIFRKRSKLRRRIHNFMEKMMEIFI
jgi:hypothetical protein